MSIASSSANGCCNVTRRRSEHWSYTCLCSSRLLIGFDTSELFTYICFSFLVFYRERLCISYKFNVYVIRFRRPAASAPRRSALRARQNSPLDVPQPRSWCARPDVERFENIFRFKIHRHRTSVNVQYDSLDCRSPRPSRQNGFRKIQLTPFDQRRCFM